MQRRREWWCAVALAAVLFASTRPAGANGPCEVEPDWQVIMDGVPASADEQVAPMVVINLTDDNDDGVVDCEDFVDVVFSHTTGGQGARLSILKRTNALDPPELIGPSPDLPGGFELMLFAPAAANLDTSTAPGAEVPEIVALAKGPNGEFAPVIFTSNLVVSLVGTPLPVPGVTITNLSDAAIGIANIDMMGAPEIYAGPHVWTATGAIYGIALGSANGHGSWVLSSTIRTRVISTAVDMMPNVGTPPNRLELLAGNVLYNTTPIGAPPMFAPIWNANATCMLTDGWSVPAELDGDETNGLEVALVRPSGVYVLSGQTGMVIGRYETVDGWPGDLVHGPVAPSLPAVADIDADGKAEIVVAASRQVRQTINGEDHLDLVNSISKLFAFEHGGDGTVGDCDGTIVLEWAIDVHDYSGGAGPVLADLDDDGRQEVIFHDEHEWHVFDDQGVELVSGLLGSGTRWETPVVADIDHDCGPEILVAGNSGQGGGNAVVCPPTGATCHLPPGHPSIIALDCPDGGLHRSIWNQLDYHVLSADENGQVPLQEPAPPASGADTAWRAQVEPDPCCAPIGIKLVEDAKQCPKPALDGPYTFTFTACPQGTPTASDWTLVDSESCTGATLIELGLTAVLTIANPGDPDELECAITCTVEFDADLPECPGEPGFASRTIFVGDDEEPDVFAPAATTVECDGITTCASTAKDNCDGYLTTSCHDIVDAGPCPDSFTITRTHEATDSCGNTGETEEIITVVDTQPPAISGVPADVTVPCGDPVPPASGVTAFDACSGSFVTLELETEQVGPDPGEVSCVLVRTWTATDQCGNSATAQQVVSLDCCCPCIDYDWEGSTSTPITVQFDGVTISGETLFGVPLDVVVFDSANPTCGETDLVTDGYGPGNTVPREDVLILQDPRSSCPDPDAYESPGYMTFDFDEPTLVSWVGLLDVDTPVTSVTYTLESGFMFSVLALNLGDNSWQAVPIDRKVTQLRVLLSGDSAVTDIVCDF